MVGFNVVNGSWTVMWSWAGIGSGFDTVEQTFAVVVTLLDAINDGEIG